MIRTQKGWLASILARAETEHWCTRMNCTTCGSRDLHDSIIAELSQRDGLESGETINEHGAHLLFRELAILQASNVVQTIEASRWIIHLIWRQKGSDYCERELYPLLEGTWASVVLAGMQAHYAEQQRRRWLHDALQGVKMRDWDRLGLGD